MVKINMTDVYKEYWDKMLYQVCWKYTNNRDEAKDLCQKSPMNKTSPKEVKGFESSSPVFKIHMSALGK